jgi:hypothetical protein
MYKLVVALFIMFLVACSEQPDSSESTASESSAAGSNESKIHPAPSAEIPLTAEQLAKQEAKAGCKEIKQQYKEERKKAKENGELSGEQLDAFLLELKANYQKMANNVAECSV